VHELEFDPDLAREALAAARTDDPNRPNAVPVASDERLSGSPHAGGWDSATIAKRLAAVFPAARILIGIREQKSVLYSVYQQYVRDGGAASLWSYLHPRHSSQIPQLRFQHWEYHRLIALYQELFGSQNVLVLPFEWLQMREEEFLGRILTFAGCGTDRETVPGHRYPSFSAFTLLVKRQSNRVFVRNSLSPSAPFYVKDHESRFEAFDRLVPKAFSAGLEKRWRAEIAHWVGQGYGASNRRTAELTGLPLESLGYPMT
jgi:hypothetical protein